jgi:hypothetical protein
MRLVNQAEQKPHFRVFAGDTRVPIGTRLMADRE